MLLDMVKAQADIVAIIGDTTKLIPHGNEWLGLCPFHEDHSPSLSVNPEKGLFHCRACKAGGDVLSFTMKQRNVDFRTAVNLLARHLGLTREKMPQPAQLTEVIGRTVALTMAHGRGVGKCPFCEGNATFPEGALHVYSKHWQCYACGRRGGLLDWYERLDAKRHSDAGKAKRQGVQVAALFERLEVVNAELKHLQAAAHRTQNRDMTGPLWDALQSLYERRDKLRAAVDSLTPDDTYVWPN